MSAPPGQVAIDTASSIGDFRDLFQQASDRGDRLQTELVRINTEMHRRTGCQVASSRYTHDTNPLWINIPLAATFPCQLQRPASIF